MLFFFHIHRENLLLSHKVFKEHKYKTLWKSNNFKYLLDSNQEMVTAAMKLKDAYSLEGKLRPT